MLSYQLHMQSGLIWYDNIAVKLDQVSRLQDIASGHQVSTQGSDIPFHSVWQCFEKKLIGSWEFEIAPLGVQGANKSFQFDRVMLW